MRSMKLFVGVAAALALGTGCGGGVTAEEACDQMEESLNDVETRMSSCLGGEDVFGQFDTAACVEAAEACSDEDRENVVAQIDCAFGLFTCEAFETEAAMAEMMAKAEQCEKDHPVSASCSGPDVGVQSVTRRAMQLRSAR